MKKFNDILEIIKNRRSVRSYKNEIIKEDELERILEAARWAPSAINKQPWQFIVIKDKNILNQLGGQFFSKHLKEAAVVIVVLTDEPDNKWATIDCSLASENLMLEASSLGIGSCFVGSFKEKKLRNLLNIPNECKIIGLITLGYPKEDQKAPLKKDLKDIISVNKYQKHKQNIFKSGIASIIKEKLSV